MKPRELWPQKSRWERVPDVVSNLPGVLSSSLTAVDAVRTALDSTLNVVDAAQANPAMRPERPAGRSPVRGGLLLLGSALAVGLGSAAVSSARSRDPRSRDPETETASSS